MTVANKSEFCRTDELTEDDCISACCVLKHEVPAGQGWLLVHWHVQKMHFQLMSDELALEALWPEWQNIYI